MVSSQSHELLDILDTWLDAQSEGFCDPDQILHRKSNTVLLQVLVSTGAKFRTSCDLPAEQCPTVNKLLKTTWEAVQRKVTTSPPSESCKWREGILLIGNSSLESKKSRKVKLLGFNAEHQKTWQEWRDRNLTIREGFADQE